MAGTGSSKGPNVLLVVLDTMTASAASLESGPARMPWLRSRAERGLLFTRAVSNSNWTYPSHGSLFTGLLPSEHGMDTSRMFQVWDEDVSSGRTGLLGEDAPPGPKTDPALGERWLPATFARAGYETVCVSNNPWVGRLTQMDHGFRLIRDTLSVRLPRSRSSLRRTPRLRSRVRAAHHAYRAIRGQGDLLARDAVAGIRRWAAGRDGDRPFFLFVNLIECHAPYITPLARDAVREGGGWLATWRGMSLAEPRRSLAFNLSADPRRDAFGVRLLRTLHERAATYLDGALREIDDVLSPSRRPLIACVTSDHGEAFGEHGSLLHGLSIHEPALRVPLVLWGDGIDAGERDEVVDLRRVHPSLLEAAGLGRTAGGPVPLWERGAGTAVAERRRVDLPGWAMPLDPDGSRTGPAAAVYRDRWKLLWTSAGRRELFDLARDPDETRDVAAGHPDIVRELEALVPRERRREAPVERSASSGLTAREEAMVADQLAALGYLE